MKIAALAIATFRESMTVRTVVVLALAGLAIGAAGFALPLASDAARVRFAERTTYAGIALLGGIHAAFLAASAVRDDIRSRRIRILLARPVGPFAYLAGKGIGVLAAVGASVTMVGIAAGAGLAAGVSAAAVEAPAAYSWRSAKRVDSGGGALGGERRDASWIVLRHAGDEVALRFDSIPVRSGNEPRVLEVRLPVRRLDGARDPSVPVAIVVHGVAGTHDRVIEATLPPGRSVRFELEDRDVSDDGELLVSLRRAGTPLAIGLPADGLRLRVGRPRYLSAYALHVVTLGVAVLLVATIGIALSTVLSTGTGALLILFLYLVGFLRGFLLDLARAIERETLHVHDPSVQGGVLEAVLRLDRFLLEGIARIAPPLDLCDPGPLVAVSQAPSAGRTWVAAGWLVVYAIGSGFAGWLLVRRRSFPGGSRR